MQSITNAAGGKCQRAHHIISARWRPAERETCQLLAAGRTSEGAGMVKKKLSLSFLAARRRRIIQVAATAPPSGRLAGERSLKKPANKPFFLFLLQQFHPETIDRQRLIACVWKPPEGHSDAMRSSSQDAESNRRRRRRQSSQTST